MVKNKVINFCNRIIEISIYAIIFYIPISTAFIESFVSLAITLWLLKKIITKTKLNAIFYPNYLNVPILLYVSMCVITTIFSSNFSISLRHLISKTSEYLLLFFIIVETVDKRIFKNILTVMIVSAGLLGADGIFQYFTHIDFFRRHIVQLHHLAGRINASFKYPNDFAAYLVSIFPILASMSFLKFKKMWILKRAILIIISLTFFICLILTVTKSAWLALLLSIPIAIILRNKPYVFLNLFLILMLLSLSPFHSDLISKRIVNFFDISFKDTGLGADRYYLWQTGLNMIKESPVLGLGLGTFMYNFDKFKPKDYPWGISYVHNCFIQMAAEIGILGLLAFLFMIGVLFFKSYKVLLRVENNNFYYYTLSGLILSIFTYLVSSFFDTHLYSLQLAVLFWFMLGLTVSLTKIATA